MPSSSLVKVEFEVGVEVEVAVGVEVGVEAEMAKVHNYSQDDLDFFEFGENLEI